MPAGVVRPAMKRARGEVAGHNRDSGHRRRGFCECRKLSCSCGGGHAGLPQEPGNKVWVTESAEGAWLCSSCFSAGSRATSARQRVRLHYFRRGTCACADSLCRNRFCKGRHAEVKKVQARFITADGPRCRGCATDLVMRKNVLAALRGSPVLRRPAVAGHELGGA